MNDNYETSEFTDEYIGDEFYYDEIPHIDELAETDPETYDFLMRLHQKLEGWRNTPKIRMIDPVKYKEFATAFKKIAMVFCKENPGAQISYQLNDTFDKGIASIEVRSPAIEIYDTQSFAEALEHSYCIEFLSAPDEKVVISIGFKNLYGAKTTLL